MRILIIGAGRTGCHLSARLCEMGHDLVVIDRTSDRLVALEAQHDILTIVGSGADPDILEKAEVGKADLLIAVTDRDEVNVLACQYAHAAQVPNTVARIANPALTRSEKLDLGQLGVGLMVSHKEEAASEVVDILRHPGLLEAVELLDGRQLVVGFRVTAASPLLQAVLAGFKSEEILTKARFMAILRGDNTILPRGDTRVMAGDDIYVAVKPDDLEELLQWACPGRQPFGKVVVAGGGELGLDVARRLEKEGIPVVLLEANPERAEICSAALDKSLVLRGSASDQEMLIEAGVGPKTAFLAVTGEEELNIISCILADKLGAAFTIAHVVKPEYAPIIRSLRLLDRVVSPHLSMINSILHFVRGRHVKAAARLNRVPGELLHVVVPERHRWVGKTISRLKIPGDSVIATVLRGEAIRVPTGDLKIETGDQLVVFALPDDVEHVQALFKK